MNMFVSKIYTVAQYGFKRLDEEKAFQTHLEALNFLKEEFFDNEDDLSYFAEIVAYLTNENGEITIKKTKFNCLGVIIKEEDSNELEVEPKRNININYIPKFNKGDLVLIKYVQDISYSVFQDTIGVVTGVPQAYTEWKKKYDLPDSSWEPVYMVEFIGETGMWTHSHPLEQEIQLLNKDLPKELSALKKISNHFKGIKPINEDLLYSFRKGEVYMLNKKTVNDVKWD